MSGFEEIEGHAPADVKLAMAIASGKNWKQAAKAAGVSPRTVTRKVNDPAFRQLVNTIRSTAIEQAFGLLTDAMVQLAKSLLQIAKKSKSEGVRLRALVGIFDLYLKLRAQMDLEERLRRLKNVAAGGTTEPGSAADPTSSGEGI